jgi:hypothetical protein
MNAIANHGQLLGRPVRISWRIAAIGCLALASVRGEPTNEINLLARYPTSLVAGDTAPGRARPWQFTGDDIFQVSHFTLDIGKQLHVETGVSDLGIGHCRDGAVWAVLIPRDKGALTSSVSSNSESRMFG